MPTKFGLNSTPLNPMKIDPWIQAARPKTLPAAIAPVLVGSALAAQTGAFQWIPATLCIAFALLIQVATNFANDYFDHEKGTDNEQRVGPKRAVAQGWVTPRAMWTATLLTLGLAFLVGANLLWFGGGQLLIVGLLSLACAILYTGGPFPLAYIGLGDIFVLIFFGWAAVMYTYYVQVGDHAPEDFLAGTAIGLLSANLLLMNNYRDYSNDKACGKKTTVVRFGLRYGRLQYAGSGVVAIVCVGLLSGHLQSGSIGLASIPLLPTLIISRKLKHAEGAEAFAQLLKATAGMLLLFSVVLSLLLIFS